LEVADIFRDHGPAWRQANARHVSLDQLKVMSAIERCRTAALGGHVARCDLGGAREEIVFETPRFQLSENGCGGLGYGRVLARIFSSVGVPERRTFLLLMRGRAMSLSAHRKKPN
jgi:hypothetical protein